MTQRTPVVPAVALALALTLAPGCEQRPEPDARFVSSAVIKTLDPVESGDQYSGGAQSQLFEGLLSYHYLKRPFELEPAIAQALPEVSEDGLTYTFRLRDDVYFHDNACFPGGKGRKVTSHDFVWCWKRLMGMPDSQGSWLYEGKVKGLDAWAERCKEELPKYRDRVNEYYPFEHPDMADLIAEDIPGLRTPDDSTLVVELVERYPQFLWTLAMNYAAVYPHEALTHYGMEFRLHPVGSGPYTIEEFWPFDQRIVFHRNPTYRECFYPSEGGPGDAEAGLLEYAGRQVPLLDTIELLIVEKSQPRWLRFARGDLERLETEKDIWEEVMTADGTLREELAEGGIWVEKRPLADIVYFAFNMEDPVVGTPAGEKGRKLRQALSLCYDVQRWIDVMRNGHWAMPATGPIPPGIAGYVDMPSPYAGRDVERAKKLLAEAGYPGGEGLPTLSYEMSGADSVSRHGAMILKLCAAEIGVDIELNAQTWGQFTEKVKTKRAQMFGMAWGADYPDAQNFLQLFYGPHGSPGPNNANYANPEFDALYDRMKLMDPSPERDEIIRKMLLILNEDAPWSYTDHRVKYTYAHSWLKNYKYSYLDYWAFKYYDVDAEERARFRKNERLR